MNLRFALPLLIFCLLNGGATIGQRKAAARKPGSYYVTPKDWYAAKTGRPFPLRMLLTGADGKVIDFSRLRRPAFVNFGFYGCHPCEQELPVFIQAAELHPDVDFIYITFDSEETRIREFKEAAPKDFRPGPNYYILHLDREAINRLDLTLGYPTKYFIDKAGIVRYVTSGGSTDASHSGILTFVDTMITIHRPAPDKAAH